MIRFFKSLQTVAFFALPIIALLLWFNGFMKPVFLIDESSGFLYNMLANGLSYVPQFVQVLLAIGLIVFEGIYLNRILNKYEVLYKASHLPALFYVVLMSYSIQVISFHPVLIVNLLLLFVLDKTFSLFKNDSPASAIFDSCFLLSIATLIYFPSITLFLFFFVALTFLRTFHIREWIIALVGLALPYYFLGVFAFFTDTLAPFMEDLSSNFSFQHVNTGIFSDSRFNVFLIYFLLLFALALAKWRVNFYKNTIKTRGQQQILFFFLLLVVGAIFLNSQMPFIHFTMAAIPVSTFLGYYYLSGKKRMWLFELSFWILIALIVKNQF